jgi:hypothetical protein
MTTREQLETLRSDTCQCGDPKKTRHAFCLKCYRALSPEVQAALYDRIPRFGEAYEAALEELRWNS